MSKSIQRQELAHSRNLFVRLLRLRGVREVVIAAITAGVTAVGTYGVAAGRLEIEERRVDIEVDRSHIEAWRDLVRPMQRELAHVRRELAESSERIADLSSDKYELNRRVAELQRQVTLLRLECGTDALSDLPRPPERDAPRILPFQAPRPPITWNPAPTASTGCARTPTWTPPRNPTPPACARPSTTKRTRL